MRHGGWIKFYMLGSFLIKMQAARLATFIKSITCKTLTPSSRPLKVHWKYWSFVALKSDSSSQHPIVSHLWLFPLSSLWHYFLLFPSACSNQANFVITTILPVNQDIIFETKLFFWFEKSVFVLWGIKWWLLSVHTLPPHWNIVTAVQSSSSACPCTGLYWAVLGCTGLYCAVVIAFHISLSTFPGLVISENIIEIREVTMATLESGLATVLLTEAEMKILCVSVLIIYLPIPLHWTQLNGFALIILTNCWSQYLIADLFCNFAASLLRYHEF